MFWSEETSYNGEKIDIPPLPFFNMGTNACVFLSCVFLQVLRLLCIQCLTNNGFKPKMLEFYCREILQVGGVIMC